MGVEIRTEADVVTVRMYGRVDASQNGSSWIDHVHAVAERYGKARILCVFEPDLDLPMIHLAAGSRKTIAILPLIRATAMVASGERQRAMLRASALAVGPRHPTELFRDETSARVWLEMLEEPIAGRFSA